MSKQIKVVAVSGGLQRPSRTLTLVEALVDALGEQASIDVRLIELGTVGAKLAGALYPSQLPDDVKADIAAIESADFLVVASPVYRASFTGLFKHLFDFVDHNALIDVPVLLAATEKLRVIAAILPGPWHPAVLAKQIATIDQLTGGRVAVNVVSGWFRGEFHGIGEPWLEHDERYRRSQEFIEVLKGIWTQDNFTYKGDFYRFHDYTLKPKPLQQPHPEIFQGGSSRAARDMAARVSDWYFTNGNTVEGIKAQVDDIRAKAAANGHTVKIGVNAFIIARETEEEAQAVLQEIIDKADPEAVNAFGDAVKQAGKASPEGEGNWAKSTFQDLVQYNDGFKTNLIGTPRQIAERIVALKAVGVDLVLGGFLHFQEEVAYFGERVLPLVRELEAKTAAGQPVRELAEAA